MALMEMPGIGKETHEEKKMSQESILKRIYLPMTT